MAQTPDGQLRMFTADEKEMLHGLPRHHTLHDMVSDTARHRMIANGLHLGVAKFVLTAVLGHVLSLKPVGASMVDETVVNPALAVHAHASLADAPLTTLPQHSTALDWTIGTWLKFVEDH
eukprot:4973316-Amphidinium_carterae.1